MSTLKRVVTVKYELAEDADVEVSVADSGISLRFVEDEKPFLTMPWNVAIAALQSAEDTDRMSRSLRRMQGRSK